jgi:hypothetical protein
MPFAFLDYVDSSGTNQIEAWLESLPPGTKEAVKSKLTARVLFGSEQPRLQPPHFERMKQVNLIEVKFRVARVIYRVFGCYGPGLAEVALLVGATKSGNQLTPPDAIETAQRRRDEILGGRRRVTRQCLLERIS